MLDRESSDAFFWQLFGDIAAGEETVILVVEQNETDTQSENLLRSKNTGEY